MRQVITSLLLMMAVSACSSNTPAAQSTGTPSAAPSSAETVNFAVAQSIIQQRCVTCHSQTPTRPGFSSPAGGVTFETPDQIKAKAARILVRAVQTKSMPQGNVTGMTDAEREKLRLWIEAGANLQ